MALPRPAVGAPITATGGVASGPLGTALPTDTKTELADGFVKLGLVGEDGVSLTVDRSTEDIIAWGGQKVRVIQTEKSETATLTLLESEKVEVLKAVYGEGNVTTGAGGEIAVKHNEAQLPAGVWVFDMKDGNSRRRLVLPNAQVTSTGDINYVHSDVIKYELEITAYPDESGNSAYEYILPNGAGTGSES